MTAAVLIKEVVTKRMTGQQFGLFSGRYQIIYVLVIGKSSSYFDHSMIVVGQIVVVIQIFQNGVHTRDTSLNLYFSICAPVAPSLVDSSGAVGHQQMTVYKITQSLVIDQLGSVRGVVDCRSCVIIIVPTERIYKQTFQSRPRSRSRYRS